jgi:hypothetical protein
LFWCWQCLGDVHTFDMPYNVFLYMQIYIPNWRRTKLVVVHYAPSKPLG